MQSTLVKAAALTLSLIATAASAEGVRTEKNMSLDLATQIAAQTVATCTANGYNVTATVVDRAGTVRAVQRATALGGNRAVRTEPGVALRGDSTDSA